MTTTTDATEPPETAGYAKGRARREEIIAVATTLFARGGYHGTTLREVGTECGISRAGLSHHFPDKESLLEAVLEHRDREDHERFRRNGSANRDGIGVLRGMVDLARHNATVPGLIGLYTVLSAEAADPEHPAHDYFVARYRRIRRGTQRALEHAREHGYLADGVDIPAAAAELTALMDGLQVQWMLEHGSVDMAAVLRARLGQLLAVEL